MSISIATKGIINAVGPGFGGGGVVYRDKPVTKRDIVEFLKKNVGVSAKLALEMEDDEVIDYVTESKTKFIKVENDDEVRFTKVNIVAESKDFTVKR